MLRASMLSKKNENCGSWKYQIFLTRVKSWGFFLLHHHENQSTLARRDQKIDDYPGVQPKTTFTYCFVHNCNKTPKANVQMGGP